ncbi:MAG TPA: hypothetical protein VMF56_02125 [Acidobacteriaceae bacterium]|nr:hypothetical protein [Acidobacteriaceae bacterium]
MDRRDFIKASAIASASSLMSQVLANAQRLRPQRIAVRNLAPDSIKTRLAMRELLSGLRMLNSAAQIDLASDAPTVDTVQLTLQIEPSRFRQPEEYEIASSGKSATLYAVNEQALLYAVFDFLERQGLVFGIDGTTVPIDLPASLQLPLDGQRWSGSPRFAVRGLLPWPDFLNCISVYNEEDFRAYFGAMLRMRFNMFGMHVYTQNDPNPMAESYLSFEFAGSGHRAALEDTTMRSWGYLPQRTSTYSLGAAEFFDTDTFGADATRLAADNWDIAARTTAMMRSAFNFAGDLGIRTGIGFEPYQNPAEIIRALPPEALSHPNGFIESTTARDLLERRLADLLERYPMVDYVWLWQDENANWESREKKIPLSVTPFLQAHNFLKRNAPDKQLVVAGWGGVTRHFQSLHERLPEDIVFSALSDSLGWDPVNEAFGKLGSRQRWPIPWLEDDPSMWFPQFRASRFEMDMNRAQNFGCQGVLGIHWRHRIVDPTATYLARASWDSNLTASQHYQNFCAAMASGGRADEMAALFEECDRGHDISSTFLGTRDKQGFANTLALTGDYDEAFDYATVEPEATVLPHQRATAEKFKALLSEATSPTERDRIGYFASFVGFMVSYCDAFEKAHELNAVLQRTVTLRANGNNEAARAEVLQRGVPLWLAIAPLARQTMVEYQAAIATRNDQGQLASMQNKFVRLSLERLRLSIKEFLGNLPDEMDSAYVAATSATGANRPRIFIPTRPSLLKPGESLRIFIVAPGQQTILPIQLRTRRQGAQAWQSSATTHVGRSVYSAKLGPFAAGDEVIEYYATTASGQENLTAPPQAPQRTYTLTVLA